MAITVTPVRGARGVQGTVREEWFDITLDSSYPTGGYALDARTLGLGKTLFSVTAVAQSNTGGTAITAMNQFNWNPDTQKLQVFVGGGTPSGTIGGNVTVVGGGIGEAIGINPDTNAGVLSKAAATNRTIPIATFLGAAPTFTGTAATAGNSEVANGTSLATVKVRVRAVGI